MTLRRSPARLGWPPHDAQAVVGHLGVLLESRERAAKVPTDARFCLSVCRPYSFARKVAARHKAKSLVTVSDASTFKTFALMRGGGGVRTRGSAAAQALVGWLLGDTRSPLRQ